jgi:hypothetical protein
MEAKLANGMENKVELMSPGVLVRIQSHFGLDDNCDEYQMTAVVH